MFIGFGIVFRRESRIGTHRRDQFHTVSESDVLRERFTIPRGNRDLVNSQRVRHAIVREHDNRIDGAARTNGQHFIAFPNPCTLDATQSADAFDPPLSGQHDVGILLENVRLGIVFGDVID